MTEHSFCSTKFFQFIENQKLMGTKCKSCHELYLPPRPLCIGCFSDEMEWVEFSGRGRLQAFTSITVGPTFMIDQGYDRKNPYCCGIVKLEEGPQISGQILGVESKTPEMIKIGIPVKVEFLIKEEKGKRRYWLGFRVEK
ncbi:MAG: Zn-ribbon domain-containing OB-fold protein [Candidatus Anstonellales archaeon]